MADDAFERFARNATTGTILGLRKLEGATFTEADRRAMEEGLGIIRVAMVQPVGATSAAGRIKGAVTDAEYERGKILVVMGAMQLWASGRLDEVEVDDDSLFCTHEAPADGHGVEREAR